jgi:hypothetical protein
MSTQSPSHNPLARVKQEFGGKDKLVDKIVGLVDAGDESKDDLRKRLLGAANKKLIRLHAVATAVKQEGGHDKLVAATAASLGRAKDKDYVEKLSGFPDARLLDIKQSADRRSQRAAKGTGPNGGGAKPPASAAPKKTPARARAKASAEKTA